MCIVVLNGLNLLIFRKRVFRLGNVQIWVYTPCYVVDFLILRNRFSASKRSNMSSAVLEVGRFTDIYEFCFQAAKRSEMNCDEVQGVLLLIVRNGIFRLRNFQIRAVPSCKRVDLLILRNSFSRCEMLKYGQCCPAMKLIC